MSQHGIDQIDERAERLYVTSLLDQDQDFYTERYTAMSDDATSQMRGRLDVPYGEHQRQRLDVFVPESSQPVPLIIFLHGGYWRANTKEHRRFLARQWYEAGIGFALVNYRIAPHGSLEQMLDDSEHALKFLVDHAADYGIDASRVVLSGNSAGAHLAAFTATRIDTSSSYNVAGVCLLSGLFDLRPLLATSIKPALGLDRESTIACSPVFAESFQPKSLIFVGAEESKPFISQSQLYHAQRQALMLPSQFRILEGKGHFSIIGDLADPNGTVGSEILKLVAA